MPTIRIFILLIVITPHMSLGMLRFLNYIPLKKSLRHYSSQHVTFEDQLKMRSVNFNLISHMDDRNKKLQEKLTKQQAIIEEYKEDPEKFSCGLLRNMPKNYIGWKRNCK